MKNDKIQRVAILGAGTMGRDITISCALAGFEVVLFDVSDSLLQNVLTSISESIDRGVQLGKTDKRIGARAKEAIALTTLVELQTDV